MEVVVAIEEGKVSFGVALVVILPIRVNMEQLMEGRVKFGLSNKVVIDAKRIFALLLHELN